MVRQHTDVGELAEIGGKIEAEWCARAKVKMRHAPSLLCYPSLWDEHQDDDAPRVTRRSVARGTNATGRVGNWLTTPPSWPGCEDTSGSAPRTTSARSRSTMPGPRTGAVSCSATSSSCRPRPSGSPLRQQ